MACLRGRDVSGSWLRTAAEDTEGYPGFRVHDAMSGGSITFGRSRLAVWAVTADLVKYGWERGVAESYEPPTGEAEFAELLHNVFQLRGEFGRLLLAMANAERRESRAWERWDRRRPIPKAWWTQPDVYGPVVEQMRRCLALFDDEKENADG
jgi:hypothetical protein